MYLHIFYNNLELIFQCYQPSGGSRRQNNYIPCLEYMEDTHAD